MKFHRLALVLGLAFFGCNGEQPTDSGSDADTDADTDSDTDADADNDDDIAHATNVEFGAYFEFIQQDDLDDAGDRDFYKIDALKGDTFSVHAMGATKGDGEPDTVVRIYGPDEALIGENDDLPFRINGTDAGTVFRADEDGAFYVEVLEWSDWAGDPAQGGTGWDYTVAIYGGFDELNDGKNESIADELAHIETLYDTTEGNEEFSWYGDPWSADIQEANGYLFTTGALTDAADIDTFGLRFDPRDDADTFIPGVIGFSMFPDIVTDLDAQFDLYDGDGNLIVSTTDVDVTIDYVGMDWDQGILLPVLEPGDYFLQVKDASGKSGVNNWYALLANSTPYNTEVVTFHDLDSGGEVDFKDSTDAIMTESTTTADSYYGFVLGRLEDLADDFDSFRLTNGVFAGNFVYVDCSTAVNASDARIHIDLVDQTGAVLDSADTQPDQADDPRIVEFEIPSNATDLYLMVNRDDGNTAAGKSAYYQCFVGSDTTDDSADF